MHFTNIYQRSTDMSTTWDALARPHKLVSLWDMHRLLANHFSRIIFELAEIKMLCSQSENQHLPLADTLKPLIMPRLTATLAACGHTGLTASQRLLLVVMDRMNSSITLGVLSELIDAVQKAAEGELGARMFMIIPQEDAPFFDADDGFGPLVSAAFPTSAGNIREARSCFALGRNTAAVFHAMCALEPALHLLAKSAKVKMKKSFDMATWGHVLTNIEKQIAVVQQQHPGKRRNKRLTFLSACAQDFRYFKDAWRDHCMHARGDYDRGQAMSVLVNAQALMIRLAPLVRIKKGKAPANP